MTGAAELSGAWKRYGPVEALKDVHLAIAPGEVVAILGPNGAGKTTAINLMLGLRRPTAGRVRLLSREPEAVLRAPFGRGLEISELEVAGASLEEAVVSLTARRGGDDGAVAGRAAEARA